MSAPITLRPAEPGDDPAIATLPGSARELFFVQPGGKYPWDVKQVGVLRVQRSDLTVLQEGDTVVGFADIYGFTPRDHAFIGNLVIASTHRGKGLGRRLIAHMLTLIFERYRLPEARISVFEANEQALSLYRRLGFEEYGEEQRKDADGGEWRLLHLRKRRLI